MDPYETLGLSHDATPTQIKVAYRKLALEYHPDRQRTRSLSPTGDAPPDAASADDSTRKFAQIAAAHALLSDPERKKEYDHLYKFGAFDKSSGASGGGPANGVTTSAPTSNNYQYTEDYSGGYYKPGYKPPEANTARHYQRKTQWTSSATVQSMQSQDSFFDDLIYSPKSKQDQSTTQSTNNENTNTNNASSSSTFQQPKKPGIGFSIRPAGRHLSVHVPSRNEVMSNMTRGDMPRGAHLFGTRVTFSQQFTSGVSNLDRIAEATCTGMCPGSDALNTKASERTVVSTTTRIAKGQKRVVKRTAHVRPDGTKEVVVEENGVVRRRYVQESASNAAATSDVRDDSETGSPGGSRATDGGDEKDSGNGGLRTEAGFTLIGLFKSCLSPCSTVAS